MLLVANQNTLKFIESLRGQQRVVQKEGTRMELRYQTYFAILSCTGHINICGNYKYRMFNIINSYAFCLHYEFHAALPKLLFFH